MVEIKTIQAKIIKFIDLKANNDGAILFLNGPWGSGKTYFWKSITKAVKPSPLYVSLFGVKDAKDVKTKLVTALIAGDESKGVIQKAKAFVTKNIGNVISGLSGINIELDVLDLITTRKIICFDDLERLSSDCNIEEILGFVNHLAEHKGHRCLVILNDSEMPDLVKNHFFRLREKLSFSTIEYRTDLKTRIHSFIEEKIGNSTQHERGVIVEQIATKLNISNLRLIKTAIAAIADMKELSKAPLPDNVIIFLIALLAKDTEGTRHDASFFKFNPVQLQIKEPSPSDEVATEQKTFYEKYFGENYPYRFLNSVFQLVREGTIDSDLFREEVVGIDSNKDDVAKFIDSVRDTHFFFSKDSELLAIQTKISALFSAKRVFHFNEVATLVRTLSTSIKLLEQPFPIALPAQLLILASESIKSFENIRDLESAFGYRGDELIFSFARDLQKVVSTERLRRAMELYKSAIQNSDSEKLRTAVEIDGECLLQVATSGDFKNILDTTSTELAKTSLVTLIIEGLQLQHANIKAKAELNKVHAELTGKYFGTAEKTDRLRVYRLIEKTGQTKPHPKPDILF